MAFLEHLQEFFSSIKSIRNISSKDLIDIMNDFKRYEQNLEYRNRKAFSMVHADIPEKTFLKINSIIKDINNFKNLKGDKLLIKFIEILKENGYFQNSWPFLKLVQKYGSQVLDLYVTLNRDENIPAFLKKRS